MHAIRPQELRTVAREVPESRVRPLRVLVWQWGRRGAGPRFAAELADGLRQTGMAEPLLSLSARAEILTGPAAPDCQVPIDTYGSLAGLLARLLTAPVLLGRLWLRLRSLRPDLAICAMAGPLDLLMAAVLALLRIPYALVVHEAEAHPGDAWQVQYSLQRRLARHAAVLVALSGHVAASLAAQAGGRRRLIVAEHPPFAVARGGPPRAHGGPLRVLLFGRLMRYKGLDLLADALSRLGARADLAVRVVGQGPEDVTLDRLRGLPGVTVENRWVAESELASLFAWSDVVLLSHTQASQSGVAAAAVGAGRWIVATRVGGLPEQLGGAAGAVLCAPDGASLAQALREVLAWPQGAAFPRVAVPESWAAFGSHIVWTMAEQGKAKDKRKSSFLKKRSKKLLMT